MLVYPEQKKQENNDEYFSQYSLYREPFSIATDPDFFFQTRQHFGTLQQLQMAVKLNRGLCLITGEAGTGKTALCMRLKKRLELSEKNKIHFITARPYDSALEFVNKIGRKIVDPILSCEDEGLIKTSIESQLISDNKNSGKKTVLLIDDGHKLPYWCFSILKDLLAFEIEGKKLLQVIIFGQTEINDLISEKTSLGDMICLYRELGPLNFRDTMHMIRFRLRMASRSPYPIRFFTWFGILGIYLASGGYPRRIVNLCHRCVVSKLPFSDTKAGWFFVRSCSRKVFTSREASSFSSGLFISLLILLLSIPILYSIYPDNRIKPYISSVISNIDNKISVINNEKIQQDLNAKDIPVKNIPQVEVIENVLNPDNNILDKVIEKIPVTGEIKSEEKVTSDLSYGQTTVSEKSKSIPTTKEVVSEGLISDEKQNNTELVSVHESVEIQPEKLPVPKLIGSVKVGRGDTFLVMVERIYGHSKGKYSRMVRNANKSVKNLNNLSIGEILYFPAIEYNPANQTEDPETKWWLRIKEGDTLDSVVNYFKILKRKSIPVSIITFHTSYQGMKFYVVLKKVFDSKDSAEKIKNEYSDKLGPGIELVQFGFKDTVYFANPFFND